MGRDQEKRERDAYHGGRRDGQRGEYKSRGIAEQIGDNIFGKSAERKAYERGEADGKRDRKKKG